jgi:MFS family permease
MGVGVQSMIRRVPMIVGPLVGGWLITRYGWEQGVRFALLGCIGLSAVTMVFQWFMTDSEVGRVTPCAPGQGKVADGAQETDAPNHQMNFFGVVKSFNPTLCELLVSDILIRFCERLPYAFVILWAMNHGGLSAEQFGWLVTIEMVTAMVCYIPVANLADKHGQRPFVLATFVFFTLFPITLLFAHNFAWLAVAFVVRGLKEFGEPARKALIIAQAAPALRARTYGAYYLIRDCIVTLGSFLGAWLWSISPQANFIGAALLGAAGALWFWRFVYRTPVSRQSTESIST